MVATIYPPGNATFSSLPPIQAARAALKRSTPDGVTSHLTGRDAILQSQGGTSGPGVLTETLLGALGALIVLLFVFGTVPAIAMPLVMAAASILTTFACVLALTYVTHGVRSINRRPSLARRDRPYNFVHIARQYAPPLF